MNLKHKLIIEQYTKHTPQIASFAFDGCHKIYTLADDAQADEAQGMGYTIHAITDLARVFDESCSLRFINTWGDFKTIIGQGE